MNRTLTPWFVVLFCALLSVFTYGQTPADKIDLLKGTIDPYIPGLERAKFLKAAGVDTELDAEEFKANAEVKDGFVRPFDKWSNFMLFDRNRDRKADWFEVNSYRRALGNAVIAKYDKDGNKKLIGPERDAANKDLAAGRVPRVEPTSSTAGRTSNLGQGGGTDSPGRSSSSSSSSNFDQGWSTVMAQLKSKYDANGDGKLTGQELSKARDEIRHYYRQLERLRDVDRYDKDGDGHVTYEERQSVRLFARYDDDEDGKLTEQEQQRYQAHLRYYDVRHKGWMARFDKDGDGRLNDQEEEAEDAFDDARKALRKKAALQLYDTDGDGDLSKAEEKAGYAIVRKQFYERWDKNGDGELDYSERLEAHHQRQRELDEGKVGLYGLLRALD